MMPMVLFGPVAVFGRRSNESCPRRAARARTERSNPTGRLHRRRIRRVRRAALHRTLYPSSPFLGVPLDHNAQYATTHEDICDRKSLRQIEDTNYNPIE